MSGGGGAGSSSNISGCCGGSHPRLASLSAKKGMWCRDQRCARASLPGPGPHHAVAISCPSASSSHSLCHPPSQAGEACGPSRGPLGKLKSPEMCFSDGSSGLGSIPRKYDEMTSLVESWLQWWVTLNKHDLIPKVGVNNCNPPHGMEAEMRQGLACSKCSPVLAS